MIKYTPSYWFFIILFGLLALGCLLISAMYYASVKFPLNTKDQIKRSLITAAWSSGIILFSLAIFGIIGWANTGKITPMLLVLPLFFCITPFFFIIVAGGTLIQYSWWKKLNRWRDNNINYQRKRIDK